MTFRLLAIETSCDETAAAVLEDGRRILSNVVSSQADLHAPWGGVVPELAARHHLENLAPVTEAALREAGLALAEIDAIAVTAGPGLVGSLLAGVQFAKGLAFAAGKPLVPVHHIAGHLEAPFLAAPEGIRLPALALCVSGGHTSLFEMPERGVYRLIGRTRDDAAGEAYDKVAKLLGLGYPGGPVIDRLARGADDRAVDFTPARIKDPRRQSDFSFSGLKTAVLYHVRREGITPVAPGETPSKTIVDLVASFQRAVVQSLVGKMVAAAETLRPKSLLLTGGVAANSRLRADAATAAARLGLPLFVPPIALSTDNAAMIAAAGTLAYDRGVRATWDLEAHPQLSLV